MYKYTHFTDIPTCLPLDMFRKELALVKAYDDESRFLFRLAEAESYANHWRSYIGKGAAWKSAACFCEETAAEYIIEASEFISEDLETKVAELQLIAELKQEFGDIKWDYDPLDAGF